MDMYLKFTFVAILLVAGSIPIRAVLRTIVEDRWLKASNPTAWPSEARAFERASFLLYWGTRLVILLVIYIVGSLIYLVFSL